MSIITEQMAMSNASINARTLQAQNPAVANIISQSQLRPVRGDRIGDLISGWWPGAVQGGEREASMYPDNNSPFITVESNDSGHEIIQGSRNRNVVAQQALDNTVDNAVNNSPENGTWVTEGGISFFLPN